jgi:pimeloyl-ACP methyl ester carboxylesterase
MNSFIEIENKQIYYNLICNGFLSDIKPIIVFLHEGLGCSELWKDFPELLCNKLGLAGLLYDRYGHGKSTGLQEERKLDFLHHEAEFFLPKLLDKLKINNKLILFGHSDGGTIALLYASLYPEKVIAVLTEAHHIVFEEISRKGIENAVKLYKSGWLKEKLIKYHGNNTESVFYGWSNIWTKPEIKNWTIEKEISKISCPVISIQGKDDEYGSEIQLYLLKKLCKSKTETHLLENCGHVPHLQSKEKVLDLLKNFHQNFLLFHQKK